MLSIVVDKKVFCESFFYWHSVDSLPPQVNFTFNSSFFVFLTKRIFSFMEVILVYKASVNLWIMSPVMNSYHFTEFGKVISVFETIVFKVEACTAIA